MRRPIMVVCAAALSAAALRAQPARSAPVGTDSVTVTAGKRYQAGSFHRFLLGDTYRDLWAAPIRVPVLDLGRFAGGLTPTKTGGGNQTRSLRFKGEDGVDYTFRLIDKDGVTVPKGWEGTVLQSIARDQVSAHHPAAAVAAAVLLEAACVVHVTPVIAVMPDDPRLGKFQKDFAGTLGMIEVYPDKGDGFGGATSIIDSEDLWPLLSSSPVTSVDTRALIRARLMDMFLNDWDRHGGNWKWGRFPGTPDSVWTPIPRDRDKPFIHYGGFVAQVSQVSPRVIKFKGPYPGIKGLLWNSEDLDRRLLTGLEKPVWDSIARDLTARLTDRVIDDALAAMPAEYRSVVPSIASKLRMRRDSIPAQAERFYLFLARTPEIQGTEVADQADITRNADATVRVVLRGPEGRTYYDRTFHPAETEEIRVYLHGGDDQAIVTGAAENSVRLRVIGGNGTNTLADSSSVGGRRNPTWFYDQGTVTNVHYEPDTIPLRRPWYHDDAHWVKPGLDRGSKMAPVPGIGVNGDLGVILKLGIRQTEYAFRRHPYASLTSLTGEYATGVGGFRVTALLDRRSESRLHYIARARMSEIEVINFHGLGNDAPDLGDAFHDVDQRQWQLQTQVAYRLADRSDITFGPVLQYSTTARLPGSFLEDQRPYGVGDFGQAGLRAGIYVDKRDRAGDPRKGVLAELSGTWYPGVWDVQTSFGSFSAAAAAYVTIPVPFHPVFVLRGAGKKVTGNFPFHEAAFIGGRGSLRDLAIQRYAGDASVNGTAELQVPLAKLAVILPLDVGVYGFGDAGRVYVNGDSPGGWHGGAGVGLWLGLLSGATSVNLEVGNRAGGRRLVRFRTGINF